MHKSKKENPDRKLIAAELGEMWNGLKEDEKEEYRERAKQMNKDKQLDEDDGKRANSGKSKKEDKNDEKKDKKDEKKDKKDKKEEKKDKKEDKKTTRTTTTTANATTTNAS